MSISTEPPTADSDDSPPGIVFFDGECGFCNHTVNFLMARDEHRRLQYAPLQGTTAARSLPESLRENLNTLVYLQNGRISIRSSAVVRILKTMGGRWKVAGHFLWLIPAPLRDLGYRLFAAFRYRLFGRHEACRLPTPEERQRILE